MARFSEFLRHHGHRPMIVGIIGGVGSGKSTVTRLFEEEGATSVSADEIAHEVIQLPEVKASIRSWLGEGVVRADGRVDRDAVAREVFASREKLCRLESLLHPEILRRIRAEVERFRERSEVDALLVLDIPLLTQTSLCDLCDEIILVDAPPEVRRRRTLERGWEPGELERRESVQSSIEVKHAAATAVLDGSGPLDRMRARVRELRERLLSGDARGDAPASARGGASARPARNV